MGSLCRNLWRTYYLKGNDRFLRTLYQQKHCQTDPKETENKLKEGCLTPKVLQMGNTLTKLLSCKHVLPFMKKEGWLRRWSLRPRGWRHGPRDYFQVLKPSGVHVAGFVHFGEPVTLFPFHFLHF